MLLIDEGHEYRGLYYLGTRLLISCLTSPYPKLLHDRLGHIHLAKVGVTIRDMSYKLTCNSL